MKSPQGKSTFFRALSQILCAFCQGQLRNFALFLATEKQSLRNCAFGTNKLRSKRETLCTLFSHTFFFAKRPHTQRPRSQPHFSIHSPTLYIKDTLMPFNTGAVQRTAPPRSVNRGGALMRFGLSKSVKPPSISPLGQLTYLMISNLRNTPTSASTARSTCS